MERRHEGFGNTLSWFPQVPRFEEIGENMERRFRWWQRHLGVGSSHHLCVVVPCFILWFIWSERNGNVHRDTTFKAENIIKRVISQVRNLALAKLIGPDQWRDCCPDLDIMNSSVREVRRRKVGRVQWRPPEQSWIKLNVDGAFSQSTQCAGGGGLVRDHKGEILAAFSAGLEGSSGLEAEVSAVLLGILMAKQHGSQIWIEVDAEVVARWLATDQLGAASVCSEFAKIRRELDEVNWKVTHIFREGNKAADFLAGVGVGSGRMNVYTRSSVPARVKVLCRLDQWGLPNFRF